MSRNVFEADTVSHNEGVAQLLSRTPVMRVAAASRANVAIVFDTFNPADSKEEALINTAKYLLRYTPDRNLADNEGMTAPDIAEKTGFERLQNSSASKKRGKKERIRLCSGSWPR
ncbi:MAG: hypothetical protein AB1295_02740 [Candidatus Micrarchaeota archaeon]